MTPLPSAQASTIARTDVRPDIRPDARTGALPGIRPDALRILLEASSLLLHARSEEELLSQTLDLASELLVADAYGVWRESEDGLNWRRVAGRGLSGGYASLLPIRERMPTEVWTLEDIATDQRGLMSAAEYEAEGIRSALVVPWILSVAGVAGGMARHRCMGRLCTTGGSGGGSARTMWTMRGRCRTSRPLRCTGLS